jgi:hypothetical protein
MKTAVHQYEDKLLEFAYGELPTPEAQAVEAHVRDCAKCSKALSEIRAVRSTMSALPLEAAPDAGLESLLAYAEQAAARTRSEAGASRGWRRFLAPLASAMALVVVGVVAWRANQVFDPDPAMMAVKAERAEKEQAKGSSYEQEAPVAAAPTPAPVAQAAAPAEPAPEPEAGDEQAGRQAGKKRLEEKKTLPADDALAAAFGGEGKRDEPKRKVAPSSTSKRSKDAPAEVPMKEEQVALADDYSNAALRGATKAPAVGTFGLGTGSTSSSLGGGSAAGTGGLLGSSLDTAADKKQAEGRAEASTRAAPPPPPEPAATPSAPAPAPKQSYSLPGLSKKKSPAPSSAAAVEAEADELAVARSDSLSADRDAKVAERERAQSRASLLEAARVAGSRGDRQEELRLVLAVLQAGATGYEKVEALKRACDAWESLGDFERADPYCDQLLAEFPQTAAANAVAKRRSNVQRAAPAKPVSKPAAAEPAAEPAQRY